MTARRRCSPTTGRVYKPAGGFPRPGMTTCPCQNPRVPPPALGPDPESPRLSRLIRRLFWPAAAALVVLAAILTAASFAYNLATNGLVTRPSGLRMIRAGAFDTRYLQWGTSGSPVVLVPGAFATADTFAALGPERGTHPRVFAIDLTGPGYSSPSPPFDARHLAMQVLAFIRAMHLTGANAPVLVGHSSGAAVAGMTVLLDSHAAAGVVFLDGDATALTFPPIVGWLLINPYRATLVRSTRSSCDTRPPSHDDFLPAAARGRHQCLHPIGTWAVAPSTRLLTLGHQPAHSPSTSSLTSPASTSPIAWSRMATPSSISASVMISGGVISMTLE